MELCVFKASLVYIVLVSWGYTVRLCLQKSDMTVCYELVTLLHYFCVFSRKLLFRSYEAVIWHVVNNVRHLASRCYLLYSSCFPGGQGLRRQGGNDTDSKRFQCKSSKFFIVEMSGFYGVREIRLPQEHFWFAILKLAAAAGVL